VKGWMLSLASRKEEARACWRLARETDPDVTYGWLFECVSSLWPYQGLQALPTIFFHPGGVGFGPPLPETPEMAGLRARYEELLEEVGRSKVWGECSALEFREAMAGFQNLHGGDPRTAARGLTKALSLPELAWVREEILITRARTRYLLADFDAGLEDAEAVLEKYPGCLLALVTKGNLLLGKGAWIEASGKDPRPAYRAAVEAMEAVARRAPQAEPLRLEGMGRLFLGKAQAARGEDPRPAWLRAIALCDAALRLDPRLPHALETRASSRGELAAFRGRQGEDPDAEFALAVADLDLALTLDPGCVNARVNRGNLRHRRATVSTMRGRDPRKDLALALEDFSAALKADPGMGSAVLGRANARLAIGNARQIHGEDPRDDYRKAVEDYGAALALHPSLATAYVNRATACTNMGDSEAMLGGDPAAWFRKAVEDCGAALRISPDLANAFASRSLAYKGLATALAARGEDPRECSPGGPRASSGASSAWASSTTPSATPRREWARTRCPRTGTPPRRSVRSSGRPREWRRGGRPWA
ncbi:MAG: hypothetical protein MUC63_11220, partial [Planctomycetes bacterium]|nr:hypothetical protein [Planctomycetota bacterium]